jgi:hypothetical protein
VNTVPDFFLGLFTLAMFVGKTASDFAPAP